MVERHGDKEILHTLAMIKCDDRQVESARVSEGGPTLLDGVVGSFPGGLTSEMNLDQWPPRLKWRRMFQIEGHSELLREE
jgi:hypothetical protein